MADALKGPKLPWASTPQERHFDDAYDYLSLFWNPKAAQAALANLRNATAIGYHPGDLLRAAGVHPLPLDNPGVVREILRMVEDQMVAPVLAVKTVTGVVIADGCHRTSMAYRLSPFHNAMVVLAPSAREAFDPGAWLTA